MRAIVLLLALATLTTAACETSARSERRADLRLVDVAPVRFRGSGFAARESVRVVLTRQGRRFVREVDTNARGAFEVRFGLLAIDVCRGKITVAATGDSGTRASFTRRCRPLHLEP